MSDSYKTKYLIFKYDPRYEQIAGIHWKRTIALVLIGIVFPTIFFTSMLLYIDVGYALLISDPITQQVSDVVATGPSYYIKMPWQSAVLIYYATESIGMWGDGTDPYAEYPALKCFTKDQLEATIDILVRWSLDPSKLRELYLSYPHLDWESRTIASIVRETIRLVTKNFTTVEMILKRDVVTAVIQEAIFKALREEKSLKGALIHLEFDLRNIALPDEYMKSIEDKLIAEQRKKQAEFERERILILANATAQEKVISAMGEAESRIIKAESIKKAIQLICESAGITNSTRIAELYLYVEALKEIAPNVEILIIVMGSDGMPLIYQLGNSTISEP